VTSGHSAEYGFFGWREFRRNRKDIIAEFLKAKEYNASRPVHTAHGPAGEAALRNWLSNFLPSKYGVTSGYVIPDEIVTAYTLYHFDVIVYDALNSPVMWIDGDYDTSDQGRKRAIPAKHVRAVLEVKASLTASTAQEALAKLAQLNTITKHLPPTFASGVFFVDLDVTLVGNQNILPKLIPTSPIVGYWGGAVLHCGLDEQMTGILQLLPLSPGEAAPNMDIPIARNLDGLGICTDDKSNIIIVAQGAGVVAFSGPDRWHFSRCYGPTISNETYRLMLNWSRNGFSVFALDLLDRLDGIPPSNRRVNVFGQVFDVIPPPGAAGQTSMSPAVIVKQDK